MTLRTHITCILSQIKRSWQVTIILQEPSIVVIVWSLVVSDLLFKVLRWYGILDQVLHRQGLFTLIRELIVLEAERLTIWIFGLG